MESTTKRVCGSQTSIRYIIIRFFRNPMYDDPIQNLWTILPQNLNEDLKISIFDGRDL